MTGSRLYYERISWRPKCITNVWMSIKPSLTYLQRIDSLLLLVLKDAAWKFKTEGLSKHSSKRMQLQTTILQHATQAAWLPSCTWYNPWWIWPMHQRSKAPLELIAIIARLITDPSSLTRILRIRLVVMARTALVLHSNKLQGIVKPQTKVQHNCSCQDTMFIMMLIYMAQPISSRLWCDRQTLVLTLKTLRALTVAQMHPTIYRFLLQTLMVILIGFQV